MVAQTRLGDVRAATGGWGRRAGRPDAARQQHRTAAAGYHGDAGDRAATTTTAAAPADDHRAAEPHADRSREACRETETGAAEAHQRAAAARQPADRRCRA